MWEFMVYTAHGYAALAVKNFAFTSNTTGAVNLFFVGAFSA
jgi:hypothetical protein